MPKRNQNDVKAVPAWGIVYDDGSLRHEAFGNRGYAEMLGGPGRIIPVVIVPKTRYRALAKRKKR